MVTHSIVVIEVWVIPRRNGQRGLWDVLRFGDLEPEKQMDPRLRRIDGAINDDALVGEQEVLARSQPEERGAAFESYRNRVL
jgi:hypothetical protein